METLGFQALKHSSVKDRIAEAVRKAIYAGKLHPGDALLEIQLAREFHVSQTSIREALLQLEQLGLVRRVANKGTFVTKLNPEQVAERIELRSNLECMAALRASKHITTEDETALLTLAEEVGEAARSNEYYKAAHADLEFHRRMWVVARNETLYQILDQLAAPLFAFVSVERSNRADDLARVVLHSHREIVAALMSGDVAKICATVETHFTESYERFVRSPQSVASAEIH